MEAGKKYKQVKPTLLEKIYTCHDVIADDAILSYRGSDGDLRSFVVPKRLWNYYAEYEEPFQGHLYINIYKSPCEPSKFRIGTPAYSAAEAKVNSKDTKGHIARIKVNFVEGQFDD